jgi:hypothetical protein
MFALGRDMKVEQVVVLPSGTQREAVLLQIAFSGWQDHVRLHHND